jgi:diguanylate cyclase (GGDEF)-like protein
MTPAGQHVLSHVSGGRLRTVAISAAVVAVVGASAAGLFVRDAAIIIGPSMSASDIARLAYVAFLIAGLTYSTFHYIRKHHGQLDELALLVFLVCGVNLVVQLTGGARSYWQGLYLVVGGLASVAFSRRLVSLLVTLVLLLEISNFLIVPQSSPADLFRLALLFLLAVVGYNYMERAERERAERAEDRLLRLNAGLKQMGGADDVDDDDDRAVSPLSEEGQRVGRAEQLQRLESHLAPLLQLVTKATGARRAALLQVAEDEGTFWVRLAAEGEAEPRQFEVRGTFLAEVLRTETLVSLESGNASYRLVWWLDVVAVQSVLAIPIRIWDEPPWILVLEADEPEHFEPERRDMAVAVATQMSEAQALFRRQAKHYVEELELKGLLQASEKLSSSSRLVELLRHVVDYAREVGKFDTCSVCLMADGNESCSGVVCAGHPKELLGKTFPLEAPRWAGWVLRAREEPLAIRMERRSGMPILDPKERPTTGAGFLAVPLRAHKRVCGALFLTREGDTFTARELRLLRIYCNQAAVAIENAIVYERVENLAATDALTGLFNRRYFEGALKRELARADRGESSLALLMLDIDHFKSFNDTYGHAMGDLVLKKVATTLGRCLRQADVLARFGGEEFVVLLPQVSASGAMDSAERIRVALEKADIHPGGPRKHVSVSIGMAMFPDHADSASDLLVAADQALYRAKDAGRNRVVAADVRLTSGTPTEASAPTLL